MTGTWRSHSEALAGHLALMVGLRGPTDPGDLDLALHARTAVLDLATAVHYDVSGLRRYRSPRPDDPERYTHPVAHLGRLLYGQERPSPQKALTQALNDGPLNDAGRLWSEVAREAVLAHHEWTSVDPSDRVFGEAAWTAMHEVAQFTHAITWLDEDLAATCQDASRLPEATLLRESSSRLRPAASSVTSLALSGPLAPLPDLRAPQARSAVVVRHEDHLPTAVGRLAHLLRTAEDVSPSHVQACYRALGRVTSHAASMLARAAPLRVGGAPALVAGGGSHDLLNALADYGELLHRAGHAPGRVETLLPSDDLVVSQVQQLTTFTGGRRGSGLPPEWSTTPGRAVESAGRLAATVPDAAFACEEAVSQSLADGRWLVPAGENGPFRLTWLPSGPRHAVLDALDAPTLLKTAARVAGKSTRLLEQVPAGAWRRPARAVVTARVDARASSLLAAALRDAERRAAPLVRPASVKKPLTP